MKFSQILYLRPLREPNMHRKANTKFFISGRRKVFDTNLYKTMMQKNIHLEEAVDLVKENFFYSGKMLSTRGMRIKPPKFDQTHPHWNEKHCFVHRDNNVLAQGLEQAKVFTNSVELTSGLPDKITSLYNEAFVEKQNELIHSALASAVVYDSTLTKMPRRTKPDRITWILRREYGIPTSRKIYVLGNRFLHLCELLAGIHISAERYKIEDAYFSLPLLRNEDIIQLQQRADILLLSQKPIKPLYSPEATLNTELPVLNPLKYTLSLETENIYKLEDICPIKESCSINQIHTAVIYFNEFEVKNLYGTPVLETQTIARSLMKAFTISAAHARYLYGENVQILPEPIVLQCIQTDGKHFHFSVFQLNTLAWPPSENAVRNIFWSDSIIPAYEFGGYFEGRPTITSYNPEVFKKFLAFYMNS